MVNTKKSTEPLGKPILGKLRNYVSDNMGLHFPEQNWNGLASKFHLASRELGFRNDESCIEWLLSRPVDQTVSDILASHLTNGETYFFRDHPIFKRLESDILPELIRSREMTGRRIRIWSAGCSSGEEPYSIAIVLQKILPDAGDWDISIRATDINPKLLKIASDGIYGKWSFRRTPDWVLKGYFTKNRDGYYQIKPGVKKMVSFSAHNLMKDPYPSLVNSIHAFDMVFCRNVLMYFHPDKAGRVIDRIHRSLLDDGWLIVGGSEGMLASRSSFEMVDFQNTIMYRKRMPGDPLSGKSGARISPVRPSVLAKGKRQKDISRSLPKRTTGKPAAALKNVKPRAGAGEKVPPEEILYKEAVDFYNRGNYEETERILADILLNDDNHHQAMRLLVRTYSNQGKFDPANEWCTKLLAFDKMDPASHYLRALILREQGDMEKAVRSLEKSIYLDPDFTLAHFTLGNVALKMGNAGMADKYFRNALAILSGCKDNEVFPDSDGLTAGRLVEIIRSILNRRPPD